jgi:hypothetical protein
MWIPAFSRLVNRLCVEQAHLHRGACRVPDIMVLPLFETACITAAPQRMTLEMGSEDTVGELIRYAHFSSGALLNMCSQWQFANGISFRAQQFG